MTFLYSYDRHGITIVRSFLFCLLALFSLGFTVSAQPKITSFSPQSGPVGTTVTLTGTNFSTTAASNSVYFGSTKATMTAATSTSLRRRATSGIRMGF